METDRGARSLVAGDDGVARCLSLQGYLTDKKTNPSGTLPQAYALGPRGVVGGVGVIVWERYPCGVSPFSTSESVIIVWAESQLLNQ